jgi:hypothetical protein
VPHAARVMDKISVRIVLGGARRIGSQVFHLIEDELLKLQVQLPPLQLRIRREFEREAHRATPQAASLAPAGPAPWRERPFRALSRAERGHAHRPHPNRPDSQWFGPMRQGRAAGQALARRLAPKSDKSRKSTCCARRQALAWRMQETRIPVRTAINRRCQSANAESSSVFAKRRICSVRSGSGLTPPSRATTSKRVTAVMD